MLAKLTDHVDVDGSVEVQVHVEVNVKVVR